ncbi:MAG TPA: hypothetical protein VL133_05845, partial [Devosia sp.]|nr:hypothetical protein [Devosia sp.]
GSAICLPRLRIAVMDSWLPSRDMAALQQLIHHHRSEIATLQVMLGACESNRLSRSDLSRIVSVDIQADGIPVLFML